MVLMSCQPSERVASTVEEITPCDASPLKEIALSHIQQLQEMHPPITHPLGSTHPRDAQQSRQRNTQSDISISTAAELLTGACCACQAGEAMQPHLLSVTPSHKVPHLTACSTRQMHQVLSDVSDHRCGCGASVGRQQPVHTTPNGRPTILPAGRMNALDS